MIERIRVIGIGIGDPGQVTGEAVRRPRHGRRLPRRRSRATRPRDLVAARQAVCDALIPADRAYRVVEVTDPRRGAGRRTRRHGIRPRGARGTRAVTLRRRHRRAGRRRDDGRLPRVGRPGASTTRRSGSSTRSSSGTPRAGVAVDHDVIAGISAPQLLAARHRIPLGRIGVPVHITTGRRLVDEYDPSLGDVVVMLDGHLACAELAGAFPDLELCWGAYLGTPDELLVHGRLADVIDEVGRVRAAARERHGWVTDTYLLRPPAGAPAAVPAAGLPGDGRADGRRGHAAARHRRRLGGRARRAQRRGVAALGLRGAATDRRRRPAPGGTGRLWSGVGAARLGSSWSTSPPARAPASSASCGWGRPGPASSATACCRPSVDAGSPPARCGSSRAGRSRRRASRGSSSGTRSATSHPARQPPGPASGWRGRLERSTAQPRRHPVATRSTTPWSPTNGPTTTTRPRPGQTLARKSSTRCCTSAAASGS